MDYLTSTQLSEWEAYETLDPIGSWRDDYRMASIQSTLVNIHNAHVGEGEKPVVTKPWDFMPIWDKVEREKQAVEKEQSQRQSPEEIKNTLFAVMGVQNYIVKDGKRIRIRKPPKAKT